MQLYIKWSPKCSVEYPLDKEGNRVFINELRRWKYWDTLKTSRTKWKLTLCVKIHLINFLLIVCCEKRHVQVLNAATFVNRQHFLLLICSLVGGTMTFSKAINSSYTYKFILSCLASLLQRHHRRLYKIWVNACMNELAW